MPKPGTLTKKQKSFCQNLIILNDPVKAYSKCYRTSRGWEDRLNSVLKLPKIKEHLKKLKKEGYTGEVEETVKLSDKQINFVKEYLTDFNAARAYRKFFLIKEGGKSDHIYRLSYHLLKQPHIQKALREELDKRFNKLDIDGENLLRLLWNIANVDHADLFTSEGFLKSIHEMPVNARKALKSFKVIEGWNTDLQLPDVTKSVTTCDRVKAIELLMKAKGMIVERRDVKKVLQVKAGVLVVSEKLDEVTWQDKMKKLEAELKEEIEREEVEVSELEPEDN